ncbi:MAG TPA: ArsR family transcriptional regulator [Devosia sp.]|nr:ArsR family transcriptional regulator [Devosia sp.]
MTETEAIEAFSALAHPSRIAIFRLLVRTQPAGMPVMKISHALQIVPSTLSGHLAILKRAGWLSASRHQREIRYAACIDRVNDLIGFLLEDCCGGKIENCHTILTLLEGA